ncbi:hypothetical protein CoNPh17_CDS0048 [Staphylococcus phage S-CoN_Ph17]|nr:hypothetical protein CoNPh17_CDS0048 [Staphylococcus phage S-CoN_Ph17]
MKKMPTKEIKQQRKSILQSLQLDDYRDNPSKDVLNKRLKKENKDKEF